jgi:hypothetical protein
MTFMILWHFGAFLGESIPPNTDGTGPYLRINNTNMVVVKIIDNY